MTEYYGDDLQIAGTPNDEQNMYGCHWKTQLKIF
jgi:hypothetical protein